MRSPKNIPCSLKFSPTDKKQIVVKNKLQKKEVSETSLGMGLENLKKQIAFFSDETLLVQERRRLVHGKYSNILHLNSG